MGNRIRFSSVAAIFLIGTGLPLAAAGRVLAHEDDHGHATTPAPVEIEVTVDKSGYTPSVVEVAKAGKVKLLFKRTSAVGCGERVVFPALGIEKDLPVGTVVAIEVQAKAGERIAFTCGMGMYKGALVVR
jgi:plastocyanin domain-containing protein